jgi:hypothetical protein
MPVHCGHRLGAALEHAQAQRAGGSAAEKLALFAGTARRVYRLG